MTRKSKLTIATAIAVLAVLGAAAIYAQDKYSLKSPSGIAFSDFRGYEDWAVVSSARTDEVLKVIVANPMIIKAYKAGAVPTNALVSIKWNRFPLFGHAEAIIGWHVDELSAVRRKCVSLQR